MQDHFDFEKTKPWWPIDFHPGVAGDAANRVRDRVIDNMVNYKFQGECGLSIVTDVNGNTTYDYACYPTYDFSVAPCTRLTVVVDQLVKTWKYDFYGTLWYYGRYPTPLPSREGEEWTKLGHLDFRGTGVGYLGIRVRLVPSRLPNCCCQ